MTKYLSYVGIDKKADIAANTADQALRLLLLREGIKHFNRAEFTDGYGMKQYSKDGINYTVAVKRES